LTAHDRLWEQARDRLTLRPGPAPAFDMMGGPPARNLAQDHDEIRRQWTARREQIASEYDDRIGACTAARAEMAQGFVRANEARDQGHKEDRSNLAERQRESF